MAGGDLLVQLTSARPCRSDVDQKVPAVDAVVAILANAHLQINIYKDVCVSQRSLNARGLCIRDEYDRVTGKPPFAGYLL